MPAIEKFSEALAADKASGHHATIATRLLRALQKAGSQMMIVGDYVKAVQLLQQVQWPPMQPKGKMKFIRNYLEITLVRNKQKHGNFGFLLANFSISS
jgi:hypothetical protein